MFGQLIIFSGDDFNESLYMGVIRERDGKEMDFTFKKWGFINVYIELLGTEKLEMNALDVYQQLHGQRLTIIESKAYFEAYYHVLKEIQKID